MITYAQNFEDVMLARLFAEQNRGFFVDIGASHPEELSVTKHFYDLGWSGLNVEPIKKNYEMFLIERPRDININAAIGLKIGFRTFYEVQGCTALSTFEPEQAAYLRTLGYKMNEYTVEVVTANSILEKISQRIDFLKIDVEGMEKEVIESLDLRRYRPRVLLIEATAPAKGFPGWDNFSSVAAWSEWEPLVLNAGYEFAHFDGISRFYVATEDAALAGRLKLPPGYFDQIHTKQAVLDNANLRSIQVDSEARLNLIHELEEKLQFTTVDSEARLQYIQEIEKSLLKTSQLYERVNQRLLVIESTRIYRVLRLLGFFKNK